MDLDEIKALLRGGKLAGKDEPAVKPASARSAPEGDIMLKDGRHITDQWRLQFREGRSDKVYFVTIFEEEHPEGLRYHLKTQWGRRGGTMQHGNFPGTDLASARAHANEIVDTKMGKGYTLMPTPGE